MKKLLVLSLSLMLLSPSICLAGNTKSICGNVKQTFKYKAPKKNIQYRYAVIEEYDTFGDDEGAAYERQLPYGLYMYKVAPNLKGFEKHDCFEIDQQKQMIISSTPAG